MELDTEAPFGTVRRTLRGPTLNLSSNFSPFRIIIRVPVFRIRFCLIRIRDLSTKTFHKNYWFRYLWANYIRAINKGVIFYFFKYDFHVILFDFCMNFLDFV